MAVPKRKKSKARRDTRRAQHKRHPHQTLTTCSQCKRPKLPHRVCLHCGFYKGREIFKHAEA